VSHHVHPTVHPCSRTKTAGVPTDVSAYEVLPDDEGSGLAPVDDDEQELALAGAR